MHLGTDGVASVLCDARGSNILETSQGCDARIAKADHVSTSACMHVQCYLLPNIKLPEIHTLLTDHSCIPNIARNMNNYK